MAQIVQIIMSAIQRSKKVREDGSTAEWNSVGGILIDADGQQKMFRHNIFPPRDASGPVEPLKPGKYTVEAVMTVDFKTADLTAGRFTFEPIK